MLTQAEMLVVFMLDEFINQGNHVWLTAGESPKSFWIRCYTLESATVT